MRTKSQYGKCPHMPNWVGFGVTKPTYIRHISVNPYPVAAGQALAQCSRREQLHGAHDYRDAEGGEGGEEDGPPALPMGEALQGGPPQAPVSRAGRRGIRLALRALSGSGLLMRGLVLTRALRALLWCRESCLRPSSRRFIAQMSAKCLSKLSASNPSVSQSLAPLARLG